MNRVGHLLTRPVVIGALALAVVAAGFGLFWFQPWKLWTDETVRESLPSPVPATSAPATPGADDPRAAGTLATGTLVSHEHKTTGTVRVVRLPDGSRILRLENLDTSNGPDLRVWITDAPVREGKDGWHVFDDGQHVSLGKLKGNKGDQNYALPAGLDLNQYSSVSIWCDRFDVSFGAAALKPA